MIIIDFVLWCIAHCWRSLTSHRFGDVTCVYKHLQILAKFFIKRLQTFFKIIFHVFCFFNVFKFLSERLFTSIAYGIRKTYLLEQHKNDSIMVIILPSWSLNNCPPPWKKLYALSVVLNGRRRLSRRTFMIHRVKDAFPRRSRWNRNKVFYSYCNHWLLFSSLTSEFHRYKLSYQWQASMHGSTV